MDNANISLEKSAPKLTQHIFSQCSFLHPWKQKTVRREKVKQSLNVTSDTKPFLQ